MGDTMKTVFTIGHSNKTIEEFVEKIRDNGITLLLDVRSTPYSKYNPQFNRGNLEGATQAAGIRYQWVGAKLGGLGPGMDVATIDKIVEMCERKKIALVCGEADPEKCHRNTMIRPMLEERNVAVVHIRWNPPKGGTIKAQGRQITMF